MQEREAAEAAHAKFADDKSEFISFLKLWRWYGEQVQQGLAAQAGGAAAPELPVADPAARVARRAYPAVGAGGRAGLARQPDRATFEQLHLALLSGLLGNIGFKSDEGGHYQGAREIRFHIHPARAW